MIENPTLSDSAKKTQKTKKRNILAQMNEEWREELVKHGFMKMPHTESPESPDILSFSLVCSICFCVGSILRGAPACNLLAEAAMSLAYILLKPRERREFLSLKI